MRTRPLFTVLLLFLVIQSIKIILTDRQTLLEVPASSIFCEQTRAKGAVVCGEVYKRALKPEYQTLYLKNNSITFQNQTYQESYIIVYEDSFQEIKIGQRVTVQGALSAFEYARNPGNFDAKSYYAKQGLHGSLWCNKVMHVEGKENSLSEFFFQMRQKWRDKIMDEMGGQKGAILCAMLLGEKGEMEEEIKEIYQKNGYGHLLAISGLHISFVGLGVYRVLRKMGAGYAASGIISLSLLSMYVLMLGFSVSVFRAYIMLLLRIGADLSGRVYDMLTAVTLSAALIVAMEPLYFLDAGFQLSHGAIFAILFMIPALKEFFDIKGKIAEAVISGLAINIFLLPITLWHYFEIPTYSILWNLIVIPLMSGLLGLAMAGSLIPFAGILLKMCKWILACYEIIGEIGNRLPGNRIVLGRPSAVAMIVFYFLLLLFVKWNLVCKVHKKIVFLCFVISMTLFIKVPNGKVEVTMLDVGQGDCIFIKAPNGKAYLIDGGSSDVKQVGKYRIEPFLKYKGIGNLECVFVSHGDSDHCNGIEEIIDRQEYSVRIKTLVFPETYRRDEALLQLGKKAREAGITVVCMRQGMELKQGNFRISCVQPGEDENGLEGNAGSMVLEVLFRKFSMLCTGDVEGAGEEHLIQNLGKKTYQILKVSHHGSKNSSAQTFLEIVRPRISLISAGKDNSYGHPHAETIERLNAVKSKILMTEEQGAITIKSNGNSLTF